MRRRSIALLLVAISLAGCAGRDEGAGEEAAQAVVLPAEMVLMPIIDERPPRPESADVSREVRDSAVRLLGKRGYAVTPRDEFEKGAVAAPTTLIGKTGRELAAIGPRDAGALVFVAIEQVEKGYDYGGDQYRVTLAAVIVDPRSGSIVWRGKGFGTTSLGGFLRILTLRSASYEAVYSAVRNVFRSLPKIRS